MPSNTFWPWRDGVGAIEYNNRLIMLGGWNDDAAFAPYVTTDEIWQSTDSGVTWTLVGSAPWSKRHSFSYCLMNEYIYVWGGDNIYGQLKDIWRFSDSAGWEQVTSDWGTTGGNRLLQAGCAHKGELYMAGGQESYSAPTNNFTNIVKWNGATWTSVGTLPISYFSTGVMLSDGVSLFIIGGGQYLNTGHVNLNNDVYKSADDGVTWTNVGSLSNGMTGVMYCGAALFDNKIFYINGYSPTAPIGNTQGVWWAKREVDYWVKVGNNDLTHAMGISNPVDDHFYIVSGNDKKSVWKIERA